MGTGFRGTFVISWSQTEVDGLEAAPVQSLSVGAAWSWRGDAVQVDGPDGLLRLDFDESETNIRKGAARMVRRLVGTAMGAPVRDEPDRKRDTLRDSNFVVTDGAQSYTVTVIDIGNGAPPLLMFMDVLPPRNRDLWVVHQDVAGLRARAAAEERGSVICFTPGTRIRTPEGDRLVEDLREGDRVSTADNGNSEINWIGSRWMSGARLFAMPNQRPIRLRSAAFGVDRPDADLVVSPEHRLLLRGEVAKSLFNTPEVLVSARDLVNGRTVVQDSNLKEVTYIHLLMPRHEILWANGLQTESFHPASAAMSCLAGEDRGRLLEQFPDLEYDPLSYGAFARRNLTTSETAILLHEAA